MRLLFAALFMLVFSTAVFAAPSPSPTWSVIRIDGGGVISADSVTSADVVIFYNYPQNGLPAQQEAKDRISVTVNGTVVPQNQVQFSKEGVFFVRVTPALLGLLGSELPDGSYNATAEVEEEVEGRPQVFSAFEPHAFIILKKKSTVPETDLLVVVFFLFLSLLLMRSRRKQ
ncbi:MAG: hypothetical protein QXR53_02510 [Candidatus Norongarragalinales archaeon]